MKKFAVALVGVLALGALTAGAANAHCPPVESSGKDTQGTPLPGPTGLEVGTNPVSIYGEDPLSLGYGESEIGTDGTNVTYDGEVAGDGIGHGEIEGGSVGTSGVRGSSDGEVTGVVSGSGHVEVTPGVPPSVHASAGSSVVPCITVP